MSVVDFADDDTTRSLAVPGVRGAGRDVPVPAPGTSPHRRDLLHHLATGDSEYVMRFDNVAWRAYVDVEPQALARARG